ncbi:hypothetical protein [Phyllobacterium sp. SB3]
MADEDKKKSGTEENLRRESHQGDFPSAMASAYNTSANNLHFKDILK